MAEASANRWIALGGFEAWSLAVSKCRPDDQGNSDRKGHFKPVGPQESQCLKTGNRVRFGRRLRGLGFERGSQAAAQTGRQAVERADNFFAPATVGDQDGRRIEAVSGLFELLAEL